MATDFLTLMRRDHDDLDRGLAALLTPAITTTELRCALDGVRLGLTAHTEAEDIVLAVALGDRVSSELAALLREARGAHRGQEGALTSLVCTPPGTPTWRKRAGELRLAVASHAEWEEHWLVPALQRVAPHAYDRLAGAFATERLRQLAMQAPSGPIYAIAS
jgi:hypothetical protein